MRSFCWFAAALTASVACSGGGASAPCPPADASAATATDGGAQDTAIDAASDANADGTADGSGSDLPPGMQCAPGPNDSIADLPIGTPCADGAPEFSPPRPLGVGFPDDSDLLPPHVAYLTFDDGPSDWTAEILDILAAEGVHATFFVNAKGLKGAAGLDGTYVDAAGNPAVYRDLIVREADEGHVIGDHTVDHLDLASLTTAAAAAELDDNERFINAALARAGRPTRPLTLVRPPFGSPWYHHAPVPPDQNAAEIAVADIVAARGLNVMWTLDSTDSREWAQGESFTRRPNQVTIDPSAPTYADKMARIQYTVLSDPAVVDGGGAVILMHDTHNATRDVLKAIIDGLRAAGYTFGTIEDFAMWRWGRPSSELTPGPALYDACTAEKDWGCQTGGAASVCGRLWRAYERLGGAAVLGAATASPTRGGAGTGPVSQSFAGGTVELHPELATPCDVVLLPP
jgi:peptidoglycan/xylan/chitin deacetylase (PgdA/CDA1 family)